jgi:ABC-2 type transport system ATP-binding protein
MTEVLACEGLEKTFPGGRRALDGLSLSVPAGSLFGFLGLNGAGKTTTIRALAGLVRLDTGVIRVFGSRVDRRDTSYLRNIGFVLDEPLYFPWMSAEEYLSFVGSMYGLPAPAVHSRVEELLAFFDLEEQALDPIQGYSTGMKKKVSLAAAIIHDPELVVLDEPLEGVDALAARDIKDALRVLAGRGSTVLITSHVLDTIERLCTDIAIIQRGKLVTQFPISDLTERCRSLGSEGRGGNLEDLFLRLVNERQPKPPPSFL